MIKQKKRHWLISVDHRHKNIEIKVTNLMSTSSKFKLVIEDSKETSGEDVLVPEHSVLELLEKKLLLTG